MVPCPPGATLHRRWPKTISTVSWTPLPFAQEMLAKYGEFFPYGAATTFAGETKLVGADPDEGEQPESMSVLATPVEGLQVKRDALRAIGPGVGRPACRFRRHTGLSWNTAKVTASLYCSRTGRSDYDETSSTGRRASEPVRVRSGQGIAPDLLDIDRLRTSAEKHYCALWTGLPFGFPFIEACLYKEGQEVQVT